MMIPIVIDVLGTVTEGLIGTGTGGLGDKRTDGDYSGYSIVEICQSPKTNSGDLRRFAVTQTSVEKNSQIIKNAKK